MFEVMVILVCAFMIYSKFSQPKKKKRRSFNDPTRVFNVKNKKKSRQDLQDFEQAVITANSKVDSFPVSVPHKKLSYLTTQNERNFYLALLEALPNGYLVHCQTSLMALVKPVNFKDNSRTWAKRMDFVITDQSTRVIAVIELDDKTHEWEKRKKRDAYVNSALDGHHPLIRFKSRRHYDSLDIARQLASELPSVMAA